MRKITNKLNGGETPHNERKKMKIKLTQKETQAILNAVNNQLDDLNELKSKDRLSVGWKILFDDFQSASNKLNKQYFKQLEESE